MLTFCFVCNQGAVAGLGVGLALAFWVGIGSIITRSSGVRPLLPDCRAVLLSDNTTAAIQTAVSNVTLGYDAHKQNSKVCVNCCHVSCWSTLSLLFSRPSGLKRFYSLSYMWYSGFNCFTVIIVGLIISFLTGRRVLTCAHALWNQEVISHL